METAVMWWWGISLLVLCIAHYRPPDWIDQRTGFGKFIIINGWVAMVATAFINWYPADRAP